MAKDTLTPMQLRFVQAYARLGDAAAAARAAGYRGAGSGARLLQCKPVLRAIEAQRSDRVASAQEVLEYLTDVLRGEGDADGRQAASPRMKAAELLGKRLGIFNEAPEIPAPPVIIDDIPPPGRDG